MFWKKKWILQRRTRIQGRKESRQFLQEESDIWTKSRLKFFWPMKFVHQWSLVSAFVVESSIYVINCVVNCKEWTCHNNRLIVNLGAVGWKKCLPCWMKKFGNSMMRIMQEERFLKSRIQRKNSRSIYYGKTQTKNRRVQPRLHRDQKRS